MPQPAFDCVIRAGHVGAAVDEFDADIGIKGGVITGDNLVGVRVHHQDMTRESEAMLASSAGRRFPAS
jgi:hypothetical protein